MNVVLHVTATLAAVIALGSLLGWMFRRFGQPPVIGEVVAGLVLGPSLLGAVWPAAMHALIPSPAEDPNGQVTAAIKAVSQLGIILYMFLVGLDLNAARLKNQAHAAIAISHASIVVPFTLGAALALGLYPALSHSGVPFTSFALFLGMAMAITAFPVLARILSDRQLDRTELGVVALSCAAADDVTAWCLLALVVGVAKAELGEAVAVVIGALAFIAVMFLAVRPLLGRFTLKLDKTAGPLPPAVVSATFLLVLLAAWATEAIGIHAVFGAFLAGAIIPHNSRIAREFTTQLKDPVTILLLPAFFAYTGMRTEISLVSGWQNLLWCAAIIGVATLGKFGGTLIAARLTGQGWRNAAALGMLMNTRGLMELIVLNIGLDLGVISPTVFAMMVLMALATTLATAPVLKRLKGDASMFLDTSPPRG
jgi:Kef-type K+ transport system membrane component KefB